MGLGEKDTFLFPIFPPGDENHPGLTRLWEEAWQAQEYHQEAGLSLQRRWEFKGRDWEDPHGRTNQSVGEPGCVEGQRKEAEDVGSLGPL